MRVGSLGAKRPVINYLRFHLIRAVVHRTRRVAAY